LYRPIFSSKANESPYRDQPDFVCLGITNFGQFAAYFFDNAAIRWTLRRPSAFDEAVIGSAPSPVLPA